MATEHAGGRHHGEAHGHGHRTHKFDPANVERLLGEERRGRLPPEETLRAAGIGPGQTVVDLGCGPGYFTLPAAGLVGEAGQVYAVDIQPEMVALCHRRAAAAGLRQVRVVQSEEHQVPLSAGISDRVFLAFVLHEAEDPAALLGEARRLLKPGGEIAVVEWQKQDTGHGPPCEHRVSPQEVETAAARVGLWVAGQQDLNEHHYLIRLAAAER